MKGTEEGCVLRAEMESVKERLTKVEADVGTMRTETQDGFKQGAEAMRQINTSVSNLAHDFGDRMNNLDRRMVAEKEKWGETLRWIVKKSACVLLSGALVAMGVATVKAFLGK